MHKVATVHRLRLARADEFFLTFCRAYALDDGAVPPLDDAQEDGAEVGVARVEARTASVAELRH
uniref:Endolysin n=1 Tax=uncultured marine virus TaxID=186617 RepID=A0A0F7L7Z2_9VIRU|nr:endolysin [uncultured marine virus]